MFPDGFPGMDGSPFGDNGEGGSSGNKQVLGEAILATVLSYIGLFLIWLLWTPLYIFLYKSFGFFLFTLPFIGYFYKMKEYDKSKTLKSKIYYYSYLGTLFFVWLALKGDSSVIATKFKILSFVPVSVFPILAILIFIGLLILDFKAKYGYLFKKKTIDEEIEDEIEEDEEEPVQEFKMQKLRDTLDKIFLVKRGIYAVDNIQGNLEVVKEEEAVRLGTFYTLIKLKPPVSALKDESSLFKLGPVVTQLLKRNSSVVKIQEGSSDEIGFWLQIDDPSDEIKRKIDDKLTPFYPSFHKQYPARDSWEINFGLNIFSKPVIYHIDDLVHLLIGGQTGSGKSVNILNICLQLMEKNTPEQLKFVFVDPKIVTFGFFKESPYLATPLISLDAMDMTKIHRQVIFVIDWLKSEYSKRQMMIDNCGVQKMAEYNKFVQSGKHYEVIKTKIYGVLKQLVRNKEEVEEDVKNSIALACGVDELTDFEDIKYILDTEEEENRVISLICGEFVEKNYIESSKAQKLKTLVEEMREYKPVRRIIFAIDELADLVMNKEYGGLIMSNLANLAGVCRSAWINLIISTQHPNAEICPALLKQNLPSAIALKVKMGTMGDIGSKTIIGQEGAANLIGNGDCLFLPNGRSEVIRLQTPYCPNEYITNLNKNFEEEYGTADFSSDFFEKKANGAFSNDGKNNKNSDGGDVSDKLVIESMLIDIEKELSVLNNSQKYLDKSDPFNVSLLPSAIRVLSYIKLKGVVPRGGAAIKADYPKAEMKDIKQYIKYLIEADILVPKITPKGDISKTELVLKEGISGIAVIVLRLDDFIRSYNPEDRKI